MKKQYPTETLDIQIQTIDPRGYGYAYYQHPAPKGQSGKSLHIYVPATVPGDKVRVSIPNAKGRKKAIVPYDELLEASPDRDKERRHTSGTTGGSPLQYMNYDAQLRYKTNLVKQYLDEAAFAPSCVQPIIGMDEPERYRNKMELSFGSDGALGMHEQGNFRRVLDMEDSILAPEIMVEVKHWVSTWQKKFNLSGYNKETQTGLLRNLLLRYSFATGELMVVLYATEGPGQYSKAVEELTEGLKAAFPQLASLQWLVDASISEGRHAEEIHILAGRDYIHEELKGFKFRLWPDTFFQANPVQAEQLVDLALQMAEVNSTMRVLDLFCGVGTFSLPLARQAKELAGIEIVENSILSAKRNAADNEIYNTHFIVSDARRGLAELKETWGLPDLLLLDPPRGGAGGKVMRAIGRFGTEKVIYVSCNPKSLADDLKWLREFGYQLVTVQPVDQFPHTTHVECVVLLEKVK